MNAGKYILNCPVDLKYITTSQILDLVYEGEARRFSVESAASAREVEVETVTGSLDNLSLEPSPRVWHVTWDSTIVLLEGENGNQLHTTHEVTTIIIVAFVWNLN